MELTPTASRHGGPSVNRLSGTARASASHSISLFAFRADSVIATARASLVAARPLPLPGTPPLCAARRLRPSA